MAKDENLFRVTLSLTSSGGAKLTVVSWDGSIVYVTDATDDWVREFKLGEQRFYAKGYFDEDDQQIYLGERVTPQYPW